LYVWWGVGLLFVSDGRLPASSPGTELSMPYAVCGSRPVGNSVISPHRVQGFICGDLDARSGHADDLVHAHFVEGRSPVCAEHFYANYMLGKTLGRRRVELGHQPRAGDADLSLGFDESGRHRRPAARVVAMVAGDHALAHLRELHRRYEGGPLADCAIGSAGRAILKIALDKVITPEAVPGHPPRTPARALGGTRQAMGGVPGLTLTDPLNRARHAPVALLGAGVADRPVPAASG
jgi:hypothetical protein